MVSRNGLKNKLINGFGEEVALLEAVFFSLYASLFFFREHRADVDIRVAFFFNLLK